MTAAPGTIVVRGSGQQPRFALSFDDGPGPCTAELIAVLGRSGLKATFFLVGSQVERHPELAARLRYAGHELGLHSMAHLDHARIPLNESAGQCTKRDLFGVFHCVCSAARRCSQILPRRHHPRPCH